MNRIEISKYISVNPKICGGQPCFRGTRIMVWLLLEMLAAGETIEEILEDYPSLTNSHIKAALLYAAKTVDVGRIAALVK